MMAMITIIALDYNHIIVTLSNLLCHLHLSID